MIAKCTKCHHEWQQSSNRQVDKCLWCDAPGKRVANDYMEESDYLSRKMDKVMKRIEKEKQGNKCAECMIEDHSICPLVPDCECCAFTMTHMEKICT
jgi:hypothetical protein